MPNKGMYIKDIKENMHLEGIFLVKDKNNGVTRAGKPYLALNLSDKTGEVKARIWDNAERLGAAFEESDIVKIKSYSVLYQGTLQLNINAIEKYTCDGQTLTEFLPSSSKNPDELLAELTTHIDSVQEKPLRNLLEAFFSDTEFVNAFKVAPAAKTIHHDYLGGLLEHTLNVTRVAKAIAAHYDNINLDLLITGAVLHDIGKTRELSYSKSFDYTDEGRLVGHIMIGTEMINQKIASLPDFPDDTAMIVKHLILSHHGQYEFGSPKRPKMLEALLLSYVDDIDAKMESFAQFIKKEKRPDSRWTSYHKLFDRYLYTDTFIDDIEDGEGAVKR